MLVKNRVLRKEVQKKARSRNTAVCAVGNTPACLRRVCVACSVLEYVFLHIPSCFIESLFFC